MFKWIGKFFGYIYYDLMNNARPWTVYYNELANRYEYTDRFGDFIGQPCRTQEEAIKLRNKRLRNYIIYKNTKKNILFYRSKVVETKEKKEKE